MARSISVDEKKRGRGRPRTGEQPALSARVPKEVLARVDQWAEANECTRSEAVAALLKRGLDAKAPAKPRRTAKKGVTGL
jgi:metal-responsive CopG/Arc/MetJ family transcriptional regulator